jgi:hypothetical protein
MKKQTKNTIFICIILAIFFIFSSCGHKTPPTYKKIKIIKQEQKVNITNGLNNG